MLAGLVLGLVSLGLSEGLTRFSSLGEALADTLGESLVGISAADGILLARGAQLLRTSAPRAAKASSRP